MLRLKTLMLSAVAIAGLAGAAQAQHNECCDPTVCQTVFVPGHYETRMQRVEDPGRWVDEERVTETPGHYETRTQVVEHPGRWERVERQVWVSGHWVERGGVGVGIGGRHWGIGFGIPCSQWISGHYETVCSTVWVP